MNIQGSQLTYPSDFEETLFITIRLSKSIAQPLIRELKKKYSNRLNTIDNSGKEKKAKNVALYELRKMLLFKYDVLLDNRNVGPKYLVNEKIVKTLVLGIQCLDEGQCLVVTYAIMSNHVHLVIKTYGAIRERHLHAVDTLSFSDLLISKIRAMMSETALAANQILKRVGPFWDEEIYSLKIKDQNMEERVTKYILDKASKLNQEENPRSTECTYLNPQFGDYVC